MKKAGGGGGAFDISFSDDGSSYHSDSSEDAPPMIDTKAKEEVPKGGEKEIGEQLGECYESLCKLIKIHGEEKLGLT